MCNNIHIALNIAIKKILYIIFSAEIDDDIESDFYRGRVYIYSRYP